MSTLCVANINSILPTSINRNYYGGGRGRGGGGGGGYYQKGRGGNRRGGRGNYQDSSSSQQHRRTQDQWKTIKSKTNNNCWHNTRKLEILLNTCLLLLSTSCLQDPYDFTICYDVRSMCGFWTLNPWHSCAFNKQLLHCVLETSTILIR